jgi:hypothetical protein
MHGGYSFEYDVHCLLSEQPMAEVMSEHVKVGLVCHVNVVCG